MDTHEEEKRSLIFSAAKVVEYLEPLMAKDLLCKFPDNSAFDFDYSQSSLWSPLLHRAHSPMDLDSITPKKLSIEFGFALESKKIRSIAKKTMSRAVNMKLFKNRKRERVVGVFPDANQKLLLCPYKLQGME